jgi:hypothetical protein
MKYSSGKYYRDVLSVEVNKTIKKLEEEDKKETILEKIKEWFLRLFGKN